MTRLFSKLYVAQLVERATVEAALHFTVANLTIRLVVQKEDPSP